MARRKAPTYETTPPHRRPKFYADQPETLRTKDNGLGHGGNPARNKLMFFRVTSYEKNEIYQLARIQRVTASYLMRAAMEKEYPNIFVNTNHNIKPPAKPEKQRKPQDKTIISTSMSDGTQKIYGIPSNIQDSLDDEES